MIYVSIDVETTGLDPNKHQLIELGAVIDDLVTPLEDLPKFSRVVRWKVYEGEEEALKMNADIISNPTAYPWCWPRELMPLFCTWLRDNSIDTEEVQAAGKNFATFDLRFLERLENAPKFHRRVIDPGSMYMRAIDKRVPSLSECMQRAGIKEAVTHRAAEDAMLVVRLIRARL